MISTYDRRSKTKLYVCVFPCTDFDWETYKFDKDQKVIYLKYLFDSHSSLNNPLPPKFWCFSTSRIFYNSCQDEVYNNVTDGLMDQICGGYDNIVISYGQNYSGKSYTLSGLFNSFQLRGIVPRFVSDLFEEQYTTFGEFTFNVGISIIDVHGNTFFDLLSNPKKKCKTYRDISKVQINSANDCLKLLFKAERRRMTVDNASYNSHVASNLVTFTVNVQPLNAQDPVNRLSKIHFVDLAGVETIQRNPNTSFKEKENQGLANLAKTLLEIFALRSNKQTLEGKRLPANDRIHSITQYLGKSLKNSSNIRLVCHIRPNKFDLKITMSLLKFGKCFQNIRISSPEPHLEQDNTKMIEYLHEQVSTLQDELLMRNLWGEIRPMEISQNRIDFVKRAVKSFLNGDLTELDLMSMVGDCSLILSTTRDIHKTLKTKRNVESASQTDLEQKGLFDGTGDNEKSSDISSKVRRKSSVDEKKSSITGKKVSFVKSEKGSRKSSAMKSGKGKGGKKSKDQVEIVLESAEVQVNLVEPFTKLPEIDSREGLWAKFIISNPDFHDRLDELNALVKEKKKNLNREQASFDELSNSIDQISLHLNKLKCFRHLDGRETYDDEGKLIISEGESEAVLKLHKLQIQKEIMKQKLTDAQLDWLESLEKLEKNKKEIEETFKLFCVELNLLELNIKSGDDTKDVQSEEILSNNLMQKDTSTGLQELFELFQSKYLKTNS